MGALGGAASIRRVGTHSGKPLSAPYHYSITLRATSRYSRRPENVNALSAEAWGPKADGLVTPAALSNELAKRFERPSLSGLTGACWGLTRPRHHCDARLLLAPCVGRIGVYPC